MRHSNAFLCAAIGAFICGCYSWSPTEIPATAGPLPGNPKYVEVTRADATSVTVRDPVMSADSLAGYTYIRGQGDVRLAIPRTDIKNLNISTFSGAKTTAAVLGVGTAAVFVLYLALRNSELWTECTPGPCERIR